MCRAILEHREEGSEESTPENALTFTEDAMRLHATNSIAARALAAQKKKAPRRPVTETNGTPTNGAAWRSPQP